MRDCDNVLYEIDVMPGDGLCGYHSLAHVLTGNRNRHVDVVQDILKAFMCNPHILLLHTELGKRGNPNLSFYANELWNAAVTGSASEGYWMEEGHIVAFAMLYDVTVYVYQPGHRKWYAYGSGGRRGYVCLLATGGHFDVLAGSWPSRPAVPRKAIRQGPDRRTMTWNAVGGVDPEKYEYVLVRKWNGVPEAELVASGSSSSPVRCSYAEMVQRRSPGSVSAPSQSVVKSQQENPVMMVALSNDCSVCSRKFLSKRELHSHWRKVHRDGADTAVGDSSKHQTGDSAATEFVRVEKRSVSEKSVRELGAAGDVVFVESGDESVTVDSEGAMEPEVESVASDDCGGESVTVVSGGESAMVESDRDMESDVGSVASDECGGESVTLESGGETVAVESEADMEPDVESVASGESSGDSVTVESVAGAECAVECAERGASVPKGAGRRRRVQRPQIPTFLGRGSVTGSKWSSNGSFHFDNSQSTGDVVVGRPEYKYHVCGKVTFTGQLEAALLQGASQAAW